MKHRGKYGASLVVAAALGVLVFATSAQAVTELASGFFVNGTQIAGTLNATVSAEQVGRGTLLVPAINVEINCEKFSIVSGVINTVSHAEGKLLYEECTALELGGTLSELTGCELVVNHEGDNRHHVTASAIILPAELKDGTPAVLAEKIEAKVLTKAETGCILPKTTNVTGELCLKVDGNHTLEPELLASQAIQGECRARLTLEGTEVTGTTAEIEKLEKEGKAFLDELKFGANPAFVDGKAKIKLTGAHEGKTIGVLLI
jgi:hypothetical protein